MEDKISAVDIKENSKFLKWLDNYWYHYKVPTIIVLFVVFVLLVCTLQMCSTDDKQDITVLYSGPFLMTGSEHENVRNVLNYVMPEDFNEDGRKYTELITYQVASEQQIKDMEAETDENGKPKYSINRQYYTNEYSNYSNMLMTGEFALCFLDPWLYEALAGSDRLKPLTEVFGALPDGAVGEYGVRLGDTALYQYYDVLKVLPEDTVICLLRPYVFGETSKEDIYARSVDTFKAIIFFEAPQQ